MSVLKFTAALVSTSVSYTLTTASSAAVGQVAAALAQQEKRMPTGMLELARPVEAQQCLPEVEFKAGERLVVLTQTTRSVDFTPLRSGDKIIRLQLADSEVCTRGKQPLLIGKADVSQQFVPDLDLRGLVAERVLDYISRRCVQLLFDERAQVWTATKVGQTRVLLDDLEVGAHPVAIHGRHGMRLYRANDNPAVSSPIAEMWLEVETITWGADRLLPGGTLPVRVLLGTEHELRTLRASSSLPLGQIGMSLIQYFQPTPMSDMRLYIMHVIPPQTPVSTLKAGEMLYAALRVSPR